MSSGSGLVRSFYPDYDCKLSTLVDGRLQILPYILTSCEIIKLQFMYVRVSKSDGALIIVHDNRHNF